MSGRATLSLADDPLRPHLGEAQRLMLRGAIVVAAGLLPVLGWMSFAP